MYLEISNVAAALGKNPYESRQKMLLVSWARHAPKKVKEYLIDNKCILPLKKNEETFTELQKETFEELIPKEFDVKDFKQIEKNITEEYKKKRDNNQTEAELIQLKEYTNDLLKKNNGNIQEDNVIKKENYTKGNDRMYYYNITENACIGGKNDASIGDVLLEIKTRTKKQNVRRNEYDLYQLICYLLATGIQKGKLVQMYNKEKFDSDFPTDNEYGIIDINDETWKEFCNEISEGLKGYFNELSNLIDTSNYIYLNSVIPQKIRPIAKTTFDEDNNMYFCEDNIKFKNLFRHLIK
jgi:hypothetical protein